jgi:hypothetical protein
MSNQVRTFSQLQSAVTHVLAGTPNSLNPASAIVNLALNWVTMKRAWAWRQKLITITVSSTSLAATSQGAWAYNPHANANVTNPNAWSNSPIYRDGVGIDWVYSPSHGLTPGAYIQVTGVTQSASDGFQFNCYAAVNTTPDANTFTYVDPAGTTAPQDLNCTAFGSWIPGQSSLPLDFASFITLRAAPQSIRRITPTSLDDIFEKRQLAFGTTFEMFYATGYLPQGSSTVEPTPTIHFFPVPTIGQPSFLAGVYLRRVPQLVNASDIPDVPSQFQDLVYFASRAFAKSTEEDQMGTDWQMVQQMLPDLEAEDGIIQQPGGYMSSQVRIGEGPGFNPSFYPSGNIGAN